MGRVEGRGDVKRGYEALCFSWYHCFIKACPITKKGSGGVVVPGRGHKSVPQECTSEKWSRKKSAARPMLRHGGREAGRDTAPNSGGSWCQCPSGMQKGLVWGWVWQRCCLRREGIRQATGHVAHWLRYTGCVNTHTHTPLVGARLIHVDVLLESISPTGRSFL